MHFFWELFSSGTIKQTHTCQECSNVTTQNESFTELMLKFPPSHHIQQDKTCTLDDLFVHNRSGLSDVEDYQCNFCNMRTVATRHKEISVYPKFLVIVLCQRIAKGNTNNINNVNTAVEFPLEDLYFFYNFQCKRTIGGGFILQPHWHSKSQVKEEWWPSHSNYQESQPLALLR